MTISPTDPTFLEIAAWAKAEIEDARNSLERWPQVPAEDDLQRGRIRALRDLLRLPDGVKKPVIPESPSY